jgi:hypothetical protein
MSRREPSAAFSIAAFDLVAAFDAALDHRDGGALRKARGARIGALGRIPIPDGKRYNCEPRNSYAGAVAK